MTTVFVYGTLKKAHGNNVLLRTAKYLGEALTNQKYQTVEGGIPYVIHPDNTHPDAEKRRVVGEVYEVDEATLEDLDSLEGHPNWYRREIISTTRGDAYCYLMPDNKLCTSDNTMKVNGDYYEF